MSKRHVKAYPKKFREQVVKLSLSSGRRTREIAEEFEISVDLVRRWVKLAQLDNCPRRRRHFRFDVHLIAANCCTHKHAKVKAWLARRQRFHMHFVPTSSSWMNLIERFIADLTEECVRTGSFTSVAQLVETITVYLAERNANPKPYRWKADGKEILAKIQRARSAMEQQRARQAPLT